MEVDTSEPKQSPTATVGNTGKDAETTAVVPRTKGHRPWKEPKTRPGRAQRRTASLKISLEAKNRRREQRAALMRVVRAAREADAAAKEAERKRREERKKTKEENTKKSEQKIVITNPKKIAQMSKKQYLKYVHQGK